jgi:hypothetical protein
MYTYYKVQGTIDGQAEQLFGSYVKEHCTYELDAERDTWKDEGYKAIKIVSVRTEDAPMKGIYTKKELKEINK